MNKTPEKFLDTSPKSESSIPQNKLLAERLLEDFYSMKAKTLMNQIEIQLGEAHLLVSNSSKVKNLENLDYHLDNIVQMINLIKKRTFSKSIPWVQ